MRVKQGSAGGSEMTIFNVVKGGIHATSVPQKLGRCVIAQERAKRFISRDLAVFIENIKCILRNMGGNKWELRARYWTGADEAQPPSRPIARGSAMPLKINRLRGLECNYTMSLSACRPGR